MTLVEVAPSRLAGASGLVHVPTIVQEIGREILETKVTIEAMIETTGATNESMIIIDQTRDGRAVKNLEIDALPNLLRRNTMKVTAKAIADTTKVEVAEEVVVTAMMPGSGDRDRNTTKTMMTVEVAAIMNCRRGGKKRGYPIDMIVDGVHRAAASTLITGIATKLDPKARRAQARKSIKAKVQAAQIHLMARRRRARNMTRTRVSRQYLATSNPQQWYMLSRSRRLCRQTTITIPAT